MKLVALRPWERAAEWPRSLMVTTRREGLGKKELCPHWRFMRKSLSYLILFHFWNMCKPRFVDLYLFLSNFFRSILGASMIVARCPCKDGFHSGNHVQCACPFQTPWCPGAFPATTIFLRFHRLKAPKVKRLGGPRPPWPHNGLWLCLVLRGWNCEVLVAIALGLLLLLFLLLPPPLPLLPLRLPLLLVL